jgi:prefoldin subunit 5
MPKQPPDYPVLIPYSQLVELLEASQRIKEYKSEVKRLNDQVLALRIMQSECMEQIRELKKLL